MTPRPAEGTDLLSEGVARWRVSFARRDGEQLAYSLRVPGYPVWPRRLDFEHLDFRDPKTALN